VRVFVYEYLCGGAAGAVADSPSLHTEGRAMLAAVLDDLAACPDVETLTLLDPRLAEVLPPWPARVVPHFVEPGAEEALFRRLCRSADFSLVIAPEFDDILARRCGWVEEEGGRLLGPSSAAIRLTADKLELARHLRAHGIPTPLTFTAAPSERPAPLPYPLVCKPRFGAGSMATFLVRNWDELVSCQLQALGEGWSGEMVLQPLAAGRPASLAFLCGPGGLYPMPAAEQHLSGDGRFRYRGGLLPLEENLNERSQRLATRAVRAVPGLRGYFGADLVLGEDPSGRDGVVIEINPRLTTSYIGLRRLARFNLAEALLAVTAGMPLPAWSWLAEAFLFQADGQVGK
jgi:predicted ATP-grasp superfamily ATP-dependent carboligase